VFGVIPRSSTSHRFPAALLFQPEGNRSEPFFFRRFDFVGRDATAPGWDRPTAATPLLQGDGQPLGPSVAGSSENRLQASCAAEFVMISEIQLCGRRSDYSSSHPIAFALHIASPSRPVSSSRMR